MVTKELFKETVTAGRRIYTIDIKETKEGSKYLSVTEFDPANKEGQYRKIMIFEDHLADFKKGLEKAFKFLHPPKTLAKTPEYVQKIRESFPRAYEKWTSEEDEQLKLEYSEGVTIKKLSASFQRQAGSIRARLKKLNLLKEK